LLSSLLLPAAQANDDPGHLIQSCRELVGSYANRDQQHLLVGLVTSPSEALHAECCRGVLDEYRRSSFCAQRDWHMQAAHIADYPQCIPVFGETPAVLVAYAAIRPRAFDPL